MSDLTKKSYFFELTTSPSVIWVDLARFKLAPGASVMTLNPDKITLSGDVSGKFRRAAKPPF